MSEAKLIKNFIKKDKKDFAYNRISRILWESETLLKFIKIDITRTIFSLSNAAQKLSSYKKELYLGFTDWRLITIDTSKEISYSYCYPTIKITYNRYTEIEFEVSHLDFDVLLNAVRCESRFTIPVDKFEILANFRQDNNPESKEFTKIEKTYIGHMDNLQRRVLKAKNLYRLVSICTKCGNALEYREEITSSHYVLGKSCLSCLRAVVNY